MREDANKQVNGFTDEAMSALQHYAWPGNVRELQNVVERAVLLGKGPIVTAADLPDQVTAGATMTCVAGNSQSLKEALAGPERQIILGVLRASNWNRNLTAETLGINRTTLYKKMKRLGLETPADASSGSAYLKPGKRTALSGSGGAGGLEDPRAMDIGGSGGP